METTPDGVSRCICGSCGAAIDAWFDAQERIYDVAADDAAYERWLDTPCAACGVTPRATGAR